MDSKKAVSTMPRTAKGTLLAGLIILILDIPLSLFMSSYLGGLWFFARKPAKGIFSDLLFLEGIVALAIAAINIGGISESCGIKGIWATSDRARRIPEERKRLRTEQISSGIRLVIMGAIFVGLSFLVMSLPI